MAAIAERAGVTRRALYLHFRSRSELLYALFDYVVECEGLRESIARVWAAPDAASALDEWARHLARFHPRVIAVARAVEQVHRRDPDADAHRRRYLADQHAACRRLAEWLAREGRLEQAWTVGTAADLLFGLVAVDLFERLLTVRRWSRRHLAEAIGELLRRTLLDETARRTGPDRGSPSGRRMPIRPG